MSEAILVSVPEQENGPFGEAIPVPDVEKRISTFPSHTPEYRIWAGMLQRCQNQKRESYKNYGARGIEVCERWKKFSNFIKDMGPRPSAAYSIERLENSEGYEPDNCVWATGIIQGRNRRNNVRISLDGRTQTLSAWAERGITIKKLFNDVVAERLMRHHANA